LNKAQLLPAVLIIRRLGGDIIIQIANALSIDGDSSQIVLKEPGPVRSVFVNSFLIINHLFLLAVFIPVQQVAPLVLGKRVTCIFQQPT
jgi:hypothetical protein